MDLKGVLREKTNTKKGRKCLKTDTKDANALSNPNIHGEIENSLPYSEYVESQAIELYKEVDLSIEDILEGYEDG